MPYRDWRNLSDGDLMGVLGDQSASAEEKREACAEIWLRYFPALLRCAIGELQRQATKTVEAIDAVQEAFAHILRIKTAARFTTGRPLEPWLLRLVRNKARDLLRTERRQQARNEQVASPPEPPSLLDELIEEELFTDVMAQLTPSEQDLVRSVYIDERPVKAVAAQLGRDVSAIYRELHQVRTKIRAFFAATRRSAGLPPGRRAPGKVR